VIYVNLSDGTALSLDLRTREGRGRWETLFANPEFHASVRGVSLAYNGTRVDLPLPRRFSSVRYSAELISDREGSPVAEEISAEAGDVYLSVRIFYGEVGRLRVDLDRRGKRRFNPS